MTFALVYGTYLEQRERLLPKQEAGPGDSREWRRTPYRQSGAARKEAPEGTAVRDGKDGPQFVRSKGKRWNEAAEEKFLDLLAATNNVTLSAAETGFSKEAISRRRRNDAGFAQRWQAALDQGSSTAASRSWKRSSSASSPAAPTKAPATAPTEPTRWSGR